MKREVVILIADDDAGHVRLLDSDLFADAIQEIENLITLVRVPELNHIT